jgi:hypothetical protein
MADATVRPLTEAASPIQPNRTNVLARPTGVERADAINIRIPIEGATNGLMAEGA